eukprot:7270943-Prymnesium_polylepis.1
MGLSCIATPPEWLAKMLDDDPGALIGRHVVYQWIGWGWHVGKLAATKDPESNYKVDYENQWSESARFKTIRLPRYRLTAPRLV